MQDDFGVSQDRGPTTDLTVSSQLGFLNKRVVAKSKSLVRLTGNQFPANEQTVSKSALAIGERCLTLATIRTSWGRDYARTYQSIFKGVRRRAPRRLSCCNCCCIGRYVCDWRDRVARPHLTTLAENSPQTAGAHAQMWRKVTRGLHLACPLPSVVLSNPV